MVQKTKKSKKSLITAWLLTAVMLLQLVSPLSVLADETATSGVDGNISWTLDSDGVLTLSGTGDMNDYWYNPAPWEGLSFTTAIVEEGVTSIGAYAFYRCSGLTSITLPNSLTTIDSYAFSDCTGLTSISLPEYLITIGACAFSLCTGLTSILVDNSNTSYTSSDGILYSKDMTQLVACPGAKSGAITVPDGVVTICDSAFEACSGLTSITLPDGITSIGDYAFYWCAGLTSISLPEYLITIGACAFSLCTGLTSISLPDSLTTIDGYAFFGCTGLTSITLPESLTSIGDCAFSDCTGLTNITLPDSLTSIGAWAFEGCTSLTTVYYVGTEAEWNEISIDSYNDELLNAEIIFLGDQDTPDTPEDNEKPENLGDANGDGAVDAIDAARVLMIDAGLVELTEADIEACDANCDGSVDAIDAAHILRFDAGLIEEL